MWKTRVEINEIENRKTVGKKIIETKSLVFEKKNKIDEPLGILPRKEIEKIQITRIRKGREHINTNVIEIRKDLKENYE